MTYSFISHCGGEVRVEGIPGGGTAVELWFPTMAREKVQAEPAQTRAPVRKVLSVQDESAGEAMPEVAATSFGDSAVRAFTLSTPVAQTMARVLPDAAEGHTILVVDDEPGVRAVTAGFLRRAGYAVLESSSGLDALEAVQQYADIALVVMDVKMPGMNGGEAARHIHARRPELPVLFVTGYADFGLLPEGVAVLHKPYTRDALLGDVRAMLAA
jgi:CheY-like chemotaxis protein